MAQQVCIDVDFLRPGMVVAEDIYQNDTLLIAKDTHLTANLIANLKQYLINSILIFIEPSGSVRGLEQSYHLTVALIKKFLLDFKEFRTINIEVLDQIAFEISMHRQKFQLFELTRTMRDQDEYTYNHSLSVALLALMLGEWAGYEPRTDLVLAGLLHDVGKLKIDSKIISKPGALTADEWKQIKKHPIYGAYSIRESRQFSKAVIYGALYHHERQDGSGYPGQLRGDQIPPIARIISICDVFDAMTSRRPYKNGEDIFRVLKYLYSCKNLFDWRYLETFIMNMLELLTGEQVCLSTGEQGQLIFINPYAPFEPLVKVKTQYLDLSKLHGVQIESIASR